VRREQPGRTRAPALPRRQSHTGARTLLSARAQGTAWADKSVRPPEEAEPNGDADTPVRACAGTGWADKSVRPPEEAEPNGDADTPVRAGEGTGWADKSVRPPEEAGPTGKRNSCPRNVESAGEAEQFPQATLPLGDHCFIFPDEEQYAQWP
jgi:hypothetical protein